MNYSTRLQYSVLSRYDVERNQLVDALSSLSGPKWLKQTMRAVECATYGKLHLRAGPSPVVSLWLFRCGNRLCPFCSQARSAKVADQIGRFLQPLKRPRHITLTVPASKKPLREQIQSLRKSFRKLRRHPVWKERVEGGIYVIEITRNCETGNWHPHLHIVFDGLFFPQSTLSECWRDSLGIRNVPIVWINSAIDRHAGYLAKYVGKPANVGSFDRATLAEYIEAVDGLRMVQPFGSAHGVKLSDADKLDPPPPVSDSVSLCLLGKLAAAGDYPARALVALLADRWPMLRSLVPKDIRPTGHAPPMYERDDEEAWSAAFCHTLKFMIPSLQVNPDDLHEAANGWQGSRKHYEPGING